MRRFRLGQNEILCEAKSHAGQHIFCLLDPKGENCRAVGGLLKAKGYEVRVLDLINMERSHCYNPFVYLKDDNDIQRLATNLFKSTTPKGSTSSDPFWDTAAQMLFLALMFYLKYEAPEEEQNFAMVMEMIRAGEIQDEDGGDYSPLDRLFNNLNQRKPNHIPTSITRHIIQARPKRLSPSRLHLLQDLRSSTLSRWHL